MAAGEGFILACRFLVFWIIKWFITYQQHAQLLPTATYFQKCFLNICLWTYILQKSKCPEVTGTCLSPETHKGKETTNDSSPSPKEIPVLRAVQPHSQTLAQSSIPFGAQGVWYGELKLAFLMHLLYLGLFPFISRRDFRQMFLLEYLFTCLEWTRINKVLPDFRCCSLRRHAKVLLGIFFGNVVL